MKLIYLFKTLDRKEFNGFGRYVKALVKDEKAYLFFMELKKLYPYFDLQERQRHNIYRKLFGGKYYNSRKFNHLISDLTLTLEEYLILLKIKNDKTQRQFILLDYYKDRKEEKYFDKTAVELMKEIESYPVKDGEYYLNKMRISYDLYFKVSSNKHRLKKQTDQAKDIINSIDEFYIYYKLKIESDLQVLDGYAFERNDSYLLNHLIEELNENHTMRGNELIDIYLYCIENFKESNLDFYNILKTKIFLIIDSLSPTYQKDLFTYLSNYLLTAAQNGLKNTLPYLFELYDIGIYKGFYINDNKLDFQIFNNAIITARSTNKIAWAKQMVKDKQHLLDEEIRDDSVKLSLANIAYAEKDFDEVLFQLNTIQKFRHYSFGLQGRLLLLKCYYEMEIDGHRLGELIYNFADTFRNYLKRNKVFPSRYKIAANNLIKYVLRLLKYPYTPKEDLQLIRIEIENEAKLASRKWLIERLEELLKKKG